MALGSGTIATLGVEIDTTRAQQQMASFRAQMMSAATAAETASKKVGSATTAQAAASARAVSQQAAHAISMQNGAQSATQLGQALSASVGALRAAHGPSVLLDRAMQSLGRDMAAATRPARDLGRAVTNITGPARGLNLEIRRMTPAMQAASTGMMRVYRDTTAIGNGFRGADTNAALLNKTIRTTGNATRDLGVATSRALSVIRNLGATATSADRALGGIASSSRRAGQNVASSMREATDSTTGFLGALLRIQAVYLTLAAVAGTVSTLARYEDMEDAFTALNRGNVYEGRKDLLFARRIAKTTPQTLEEVMKAMIGHRNVGLPTDERELRMLADVAATTADPTSAYRAAAKIMQRGEQGGLGVEEIDILTTQGTDVYGALRRRLGLRRNEVGDFGQTAFGARQITGALREEWTDPSGVVAGASGRMIDNLTVKWNEFKASIGETVEIFGEGLGKGLHETIEDLTAFVDKYKDAAETFGAGIRQMLNFTRSMGQLLVWVNSLTGNMAGWVAGISTVVLGLTGAFKILRLVSPFGFLKNAAVGTFRGAGRAGLALQGGFLAQRWARQDVVYRDLVEKHLAGVNAGVAAGLSNRQIMEQTKETYAARYTAAWEKGGTAVRLGEIDKKLGPESPWAALGVGLALASQRLSEWHKNLDSVGKLGVSTLRYLTKGFGVTLVASLGAATIALIDAGGKLAEFNHMGLTLSEWAKIRGDDVKGFFASIRDYLGEMVDKLNEFLTGVSLLGQMETSAGAAMAARNPASRVATERGLRTRYRGGSSPRNTRGGGRGPSALGIAELRAPWEDAPGLAARADMEQRRINLENTQFANDLRMLRAMNFGGHLDSTYERLGPMRGAGRGSPLNYLPSPAGGRGMGAWTQRNYRDNFEGFGWSQNQYNALSEAEERMLEANKDKIDVLNRMRDRTIEVRDELGRMNEKMRNFSGTTSGAWDSMLDNIRDDMKKSEDELRAEGKALGGAFKENFRDFFDVLGRELHERWLDHYIGKPFKALMDSILDQVFTALTNPRHFTQGGGGNLFGNIIGAFTGALPGAPGTTINTGSGPISVWNASGVPSFDGGGYTGSGARVGGVDGRGGFMMIGHPNETIIDHTRGGGIVVPVQVNNYASGVQAHVGPSADGKGLEVAVKRVVANDIKNNGPIAKQIRQDITLR